MQNRPAITPAQIAAVLIAGIPALSNLLAAFGVFVVTANEQHALTEALQWGAVVAGLLIGGDAHLRAARNHADAKMIVAARDVPPDQGDAGHI